MTFTITITIGGVSLSLTGGQITKATTDKYVNATFTLSAGEYAANDEILVTVTIGGSVGTQAKGMQVLIEAEEVGT